MKKALIFAVFMFALLIGIASASYITFRPYEMESGSDSQMIVKINNMEGTERLNDVKAAIYSPEFDLYAVSGRIDVPKKESKSIIVYESAPDDFGLYPVRISVTGDNTRIVKWVWVAAE
ncbi:MAG: hypothetical protein V1859_03420 [archaeon]